MVTTHKMRETEMGYRGSKSGISLVKEQRVDGSCCKKQKKKQKTKKIKIAIKVYSKGWRKLLSNQNPF